MFCERIDLFEARKDGYHICRIPGIVVTKNNVVLVTTEARQGVGGDYDNIDIFIRRSLDCGKTFTPATKLVDHLNYGDGPVSNFVMIPDMTTGRVIAVYCHDYARAFTMYSDDDGATFSEPVEITATFDLFKNEYPWQVCATGPGHGLQLRNGRMIIPIWMSDGSGTEMGSGHRGHRPSAVASIYSDDNGITWNRSEMVCRHGDIIGTETIINPSETIAVELTDGSVMFNLRTESKIHRRLIANSKDGVSNWKVTGFDDALLEPVCMASMIRYSWPEAGSPGCIIFANPDNLEQTMATWAIDRKRITIKCSNDDCNTWSVSKVLEPGPSGYSDLAVLKDGTMLCFYECDIVEHLCDTKYLRLARFDMEWVKQ
ncbi:MAG: sialidase family protein [bacterium]